MNKALLIFMAIAVGGCASIATQEAMLVADTFSPGFSLSLVPSKNEVCEGETTQVQHKLVNLADYPAWVRLLSSHSMGLGKHVYSRISSHPICQELLVLDAAGYLTWDRTLTLGPCSKFDRMPAEIRHLFPQCGASDLNAEVTLHVVPPGRRWPKRWLVREVIAASGPPVTVKGCDESPDANAASGNNKDVR